MDDKEKGCAVAILALLGFPVLIAVGSITSGWVLSILWGWFIVPIFGLPALTIVQAIGVSSVVAFVTRDIAKRQEEETGSWTDAAVRFVGAVFVGPTFALGFGWVVKQFM